MLNVRKRLVTALLACCLLFGLIGSATAVAVPRIPSTGSPAKEEQPSVLATSLKNYRVGGNYVSGMQLKIVNDYVYCSVRSFFETTMREAEVSWDDGQVEVTATTWAWEPVTASIRPGAYSLTINGNSYEVPYGVITENGSIMAPASVLASAFANSSCRYSAGVLSVDSCIGTNGKIITATPVAATKTASTTSADDSTDGDANTASADVSTESAVDTTSAESTVDTSSSNTVASNDEVDLIARIISCEAGNQSYQGKVAVGNIIMNRVASSKFPNTVYGVIYQPNQFSVVNYASFQRTPSAECVQAAQEALNGNNVVPGALFYSIAGSSNWVTRNRTYLTTIGGHAFYS